jgi:hypothetical protein
MGQKETAPTHNHTSERSVYPPKQRENSNPVLFLDKRGFPEQRGIADYSARRRTSQMTAAQATKAAAIIRRAHLNIVFKPGRTEVLQA